MKLSPMPPSLARTRGARGIRGFSMVEVLIAIVVLSFGMLGMVGLQAFALQSNRQARLQSSAVGLARELAEMIRGNNQIGDNLTSNPYIVDLSSPLAPVTASYCLSVANASTPCADTTAIANAQMTEWLARVENELPGARVKVCFDQTPFDSSTGLPQWACTSPGTDPTAVIKIGWTQTSTDRTQTGSNAFTLASDRPLLVYPVTAGNPMP